MTSGQGGRAQYRLGASAAISTRNPARHAPSPEARLLHISNWESPMSKGELEVHLLGHPQFLTHGEPIKLAKRGVSIPLAAYLLLHSDEWISRSFLAFTLWANEPEDTALSELRRYVY